MLWNLLKILALCTPAVMSAKCSHPGIPRNGFASNLQLRSRYNWTTGAEMQSLESGERIFFSCNAAWKLPFSENALVECNDGSLSGSLPKCLKEIEGDYWNLEFNSFGPYELTVTSQKFLCDDVRLLEIKLKPIINIRLTDIVEIRLTECPGRESLGRLRVKINGVKNCTLVDRRHMIYKCNELDNVKQSTEFVDSISISATKGAFDVSNAVVLTRQGNHCGFPPVPANGRVQSSNGTYKYKCDNKFNLIGGKQPECDPSTGQWTSVPICEHNGCEDPPVFKNGYVAFTAAGKSHYGCDKNFTLVGSATAECDPLTGMWSPVPVCERDFCHPVPIPTNARVEFISIGKYRYYCNDNLSLRGNSTVTCDPTTGIWEPFPTCESVDVTPRWVIFLIVSVVILVIVAVVMFKPWKKWLRFDARDRVIFSNSGTYVYWTDINPADYATSSTV